MQHLHSCWPARLIRRRRTVRQNSNLAAQNPPSIKATNGIIHGHSGSTGTHWSRIYHGCQQNKDFGRYNNKDYSR